MNNYPDISLWIDPGGTTGFAWVEHTPDGYTFDCAQRTGTEDAAEFVDRLVSCNRSPFGGLRWSKTAVERRAVWVGWEQYIVTAGGGKAGDPAPALEVIGAVKWICRESGARVLPAMPAAHRTVCTKEVLKAMGWYQPGVPHAMAAAQHLGAWLLREKQRLRMAERSLQVIKQRYADDVG